MTEFLSPSEALMWSAEKDPWLSSGMGSVILLDESMDFDRFRNQMLDASKTLLRLREKVSDGAGIGPPRWTIDPDFDIDNHVRQETLPESSNRRDVAELSAAIMEEPFDLEQPLWLFVAIEGRQGSEVPGAVVMKMHHTITDGIGAMTLAEKYLDFERNPPPRPESDVEAPEADDPEGLVKSALHELDHVARQQFETAREALAEVALWGADKGRIKLAAERAIAVAKSVANQTGLSDSPTASAGSPLWKNRSERRHLEFFDVSLPEMKAAAKALGGSINDIFVTGSVMAASAYHRERDAEVESFNLSFIMSTRSEGEDGGNAFAPLPFRIDVVDRTAAEWMAAVQGAMASKLKDARASDMNVTDLMAQFAAYLPDAAITKMGRARSAKLDWATSNLRGAPIPIYVAGGEVTHMYPVGPLAGTAFNLTLMSYCDTMNGGLFIDPNAVEDPGALRAHMEVAYAELIAAGS
jgi:WS/DGAT/MGAT family acyltransferase